MTPGRHAVVAGGLASAVVAASAFGLPATDTALLVSLSFGSALAVGIAGRAVLVAQRRAPVRRQAVLVALVSALATAAGALAAARAMFVSTHDLQALLVVMVAATTVGVLAAMHLGAQVGAASASLGDAARRIQGRDDGADASRPGEHAGGEHAGGEHRAGGHGATEPAAAVSRPDPGDAPLELARVAAELDAMQARLEAARRREHMLERSRRELVAWVSHDLRTPLAGIRAMVEALADGVVTDAESVARYYATMQAEADRLAGLVDDLFELSRIQAAALHLDVEPVALADLASDALALARPVAERKGVRLLGEVHHQPPAVDLSAPEMARVLRNLLDNAIRHTPAGQAVTMAVGTHDGHAYVSVQDTCGGIPDEELDHVFDLAFRSDAARTPGDAGGAGLGLAIARGLVEAHSGQIAVLNDGGGCRFEVRLPYGTRTTPGPAAASHAEPIAPAPGPAVVVPSLETARSSVAMSRAARTVPRTVPDTLDRPARAE